jgi:hypothetical protein
MVRLSNGEAGVPQVHYVHNDNAVRARCCRSLGGSRARWSGAEGVHRVDWSLAETDSGMAKGLQVGFKQEGLFLLPPIDTSPPRARAAEARSR